MATVIVTGGAGFIGHNVALFLATKGYEVIVVDTLERASRQSVEKLRARDLPILQLDVRDRAAIGKAIRGADFVVHAAAYVSVEESLEKPELYMENNVLGTLSVARACLEAGVPLVYLSSAAVYGDPERLPIDEGHPTKPLSPYGLSKLFGEEVLKLYGRYGLEYVVLRLFNVYGPGQTSSYAGVITRFVERAVRRQSLIIYGDGTQTRDFIHVGDVARAVGLALERKPFGEKINIASGRPVSINELASIVRRLACEECGVEYAPPRPGDIKHSYADIRKAQSLLGFQPSISLEDGLRDLLISYTGSPG
ncbi:SDR family NAD(P)-dependent oxidoreductase [Infirmifilum lucidum]|uniref:SDR family NAD(P)-dependent oxidoreductase n=1 Tax=Infirmifilum lucidum TaxID=2776706 RepID=A0A7L9FK78_9CREN|nr:SDR family NAD(P)-dependent oxidoreductase [Infirmifilum lucidum]QOJ79344.1 SDR family NAD(P)-dependent oxidoreductase [Infirmifilum lucidum]